MISADLLLHSEWISNIDDAEDFHSGTARSMYECITDAWDCQIVHYADKDYLVIGWDGELTRAYSTSNSFEEPVAVAIGRSLQDGLGAETRLLFSATRFIDEHPE